MNKVDLLIKSMLLSYPTLYHNRFEALAEILTNSCYGWDKDGCIVLEVGDGFKGTVKTMVAEFESELEKRKKEELDNKSECLNTLNNSYVLKAERKLLNAKFIADNIDMYASEYVDSDYSDHRAWLHYQDRHGISNYWIINHKPEKIDEEWREAIAGWIQHLGPSANGLFGYWDDAKMEWKARSRYKEVFNWVGKMRRLYADKKREKAQAKIAKDIIKQMLNK